MSKPVFSNVVEVAHGPKHFRMRFGYQEGKGQAIVVSQVILYPEVMKQLLGVIQKQIEHYEKEVGHIQDGSIVIPKLEVRPGNGR